MKTTINLAFLLLAFTLIAKGQREGYVWAFGDKAGLDFNSGAPVAIATAMENQFCGNATVSSPAGSLLFYTDGNRVWNRNHNLMPNGVLLTTSFGSSNAGTWAVNQSAVIAPVPGDSNLYYLFSLEIYTDGYRLWYSVVDMRMDNGFGDIAQAPVLLDPGALTEAMTVVRGDKCNFWLLVHERRSDQFRAYEINAAGVAGTPVISHSGTLGAAIFSFGNYNLGGLKVAPNRRRLSGNWALTGLGDYYLELYDFDPMTGRVFNAIRIEGPSRHHYNTCFSPDNSKLYTIGDGWVHQFDLSLPTAADIAASKTDLLNGRYVVTHGDLKRGPDGKVYFIFRNVGAMHQINFPNLAGAACSVAHMTVPFVTGTNANWGLPNENLEALPPEDLLTTTRYAGMCAPDSVLLQADTPGINYVWSTTERTPSIVADTPGVYTVRYTHDCTHHLDTFIVMLYPEYPSLFNNGFSCIGRQEGMAWLRTQPQDTSVFTYTWMDGAGSVIRTATDSNGDTLARLDPGDYTVRVSTPFGCDTGYEFSIRPLPLPQVRFEAGDKVCMDQPVVLQNTSPDDAAYTWDFGDGSGSTEISPVHYYRSRGIYTVVLSAENVDGCKDTFTKDIAVGDKDFLLLEADKPEHLFCIAERLIRHGTFQIIIDNRGVGKQSRTVRRISVVVYVQRPLCQFVCDAVAAIPFMDGCHEIVDAAE